jgi:uncharacterized damage-inducible protein DinB
MDKGTQLLVDLANQECLKGSLNGPSLLETLRSLGPKEAVSTDTYEGYSAWTVALHVLYLKHLVGRALAGKFPKYEYEETDFPKSPAKPTKDAWEKVIADIEKAHRALINAVKNAPEGKLDEKFPAWKMPFGKAVAWLVSHDVAHNGQIRNMGLPSLRTPMS